MSHSNKAFELSEVDVAFQGHKHFPFPVEEMDSSESVSRRQAGRPRKRLELELQDGGPTDVPEKVPNKPTLDANVYATKKSVAQGMLDVALLTANASQLKYLLQVGEEHQFYHLMLVLISFSIILQIAVGVLIIVLGSMNVNEEKQQRPADIINNVVTVGVFLITIINIFISALGMKDSDDQPVRYHTLR